MRDRTPFFAENPPLRRPRGAPRPCYGQLPEHVIAAVLNLKLWGVYAYLDLLAGRSCWVKSTLARLARRTERSAGTFGAWVASLEAIELLSSEGCGRARIFRTTRRGGGYGRLPETVVAATGRVELWGLYAWLGLDLRPGEYSLRLSYNDIAAALQLTRPRVNRLMLDLAELGLVVLGGRGDCRVITLLADAPTSQPRPPAPARAPSAAPREELQPGGPGVAPERAANERGSQRSGGAPINQHRSHTIPPPVDPDRQQLRDPARDRDAIATCLGVWEEALGPVPEDARAGIPRYVRVGRGADLLHAIGWSSGREINPARLWRYVETVLWNPGWLSPPPASAPPAPAGALAGEDDSWLVLRR